MQKFDKITLISQFQDYDFGRGLYLLAHADSDTLGRGTLLISEGEDDGFFPDNGADNETIFEDQTSRAAEIENLTSSELFDGIMSLPVGFSFSSVQEFYQGVKQAVESLPLSP